MSRRRFIVLAIVIWLVTNVIPAVIFTVLLLRALAG